ncbi:hypothetical protein mRhiFer1_008532 [Rhinolophus ferrumequinum]|uniref:Uncharacterized protein n=1 Tax=Rhinolophus ferrumequinum TaxID=59479 RepID=A0A7J7UXH2_RHIFE|nr:hypothetical protein mRhiFer1_008532 [Rhinolophus ferrumequinum]
MSKLSELARGRGRSLVREGRPVKWIHGQQSPSHYHGTNYGLPRTPPAGGVPRVLETAQGPPPGSRPEPALAHPRDGSVLGASWAARPGGTDVARWRRGRPERTHPRPKKKWPPGPERPAAKSTRGCTVQLSSLRLETMTRLLAPRLAENPWNAGNRSERRSPGRRASRDVT